MKVNIIDESGYYPALFGLGLSHGLTSDQSFVESGLIAGDADAWSDHAVVLERLQRRAASLAGMGKGHDKFLESIVVWLDVAAPRYFWQEFDTYRVGMTKQSESTMHTASKRNFVQSDFEGENIPHVLLSMLNEAVEKEDFMLIKKLLPECYLQRRIVCTNYKVLLNILQQRSTHRLAEWRIFSEAVLSGVGHPELLSRFE